MVRKNKVENINHTFYPIKLEQQLILTINIKSALGQCVGRHGETGCIGPVSDLNRLLDYC